MGLVNELQIIASDPKSSTLDVLRKALVVSKKLGQNDLSDWISKELNGYTDNEKLPSYRCLLANVMYNSLNRFEQFERMRFDPMPQIDEKINLPITEIESICNSSENYINISPKSEQNYKLQEFALRCNKNSIFEFYYSINKSQFFNILESCKTKVLEWALQLESIGVVGEDHTFQIYTPLLKKKSSWIVAGVALFGVIGGICSNWISGYTQNYVNFIFDAIKLYLNDFNV